MIAVHRVGRAIDQRDDRHRSVGRRQVDVLCLARAVRAPATHLRDQAALLVIDIGIAELLGGRRGRTPQLAEERNQTVPEARIVLVPLTWRIQRLGLEHALTQGVVRVARRRADVVGARRGRGQAAFRVVAIAPETVARQVAVGVVPIGDAGAAGAVDGLTEAGQAIATRLQGVAAAGGLACTYPCAGCPVPVGVVAELALSPLPAVAVKLTMRPVAV